MKVHRRGASSPSLLLEASEPPTSVNVNDNYYQFELEPHHVERGKRGQKIFVCDLCPAPGGVFKRSFSLKRHYLRFHINFAFLSPRDVNNCAIAVAGQHQRSGFPGSGPNDRLANRLNNPSPLLFRCHHCGRLLRTKKDLLKHLESHGGSSQTVTAELINGDRQQGGTNRCPRCSTAFSLRKTLLRHVKKNQCRGGNQSPPELLGPPSKLESETGLQSGETSEAGDDCMAISPAEESEEIDVETSLRLGCPASLFRFACTLCAKMFNSYISMCRHRRLAHGLYGICSPGWFLSRKLSGKPTSHQATTLSPIASSGSNANFQDLSHIVDNANDNLNRYLDGKRNHIRSIAPTDDKVDVAEAEDGDLQPPQRWSWRETNFSVSEVHKLDVPIQMAYRDGLQSWKLQEIAETVGNTSQAGPEEMDISTALNLCPAKTVSSVKVESAIRHPEFSGEWIRKKRYICSPCGEIFHDFLALLDHQQKGHNGVCCTHIQLDQSIGVGLADELTRQITRSGNGGLHPAQNTYQCTKCHFVVESIPELHSHILLCSNHVSASPDRKRRLKVNPSSRRSHWNQSEPKNGRSRGMQRTISSQTKNASAARSLRTRSPKEAADKDAPGGLRRSTRRVLSFSEPPPTKKKKGSVTQRLLRQRVNSQQDNESVTPVRPRNEIKRKNASMDTKSTSISATGLHECDGCQKKFQSHTSVLKHKHYCPKKVNEAIEGPARISVPAKKLISTTTEGQIKKLIQDSGKNKSHIGSPSTKRKSDVLPSSLVTDSKSAILTRINGNHPTVSSAQKKKSNKPSTPAAPTQVSSAKPPVKLKVLSKNVSGSTKSQRKTTKSASVKEEKEAEETPVALERRPVRSSRKVSMTLVMEDQVEASFLEALSPEQRVRVTEQRCPFCSKHYVYRSNFKRHLLEGCDAVDVDDLPVNLSSMSSKDKKQADTVSPSSHLKTEGKAKTNRSQIDIKIPGNTSQKKAVDEIEDASEAKSKKTKTVKKKNVKKPSTLSKSKSAKLQQPKKSTEKRAPKEAVTQIELARQPSRKAKQIVRKEEVRENQQQRKGKSSGTQANSSEKKKRKDKEEKIVNPSTDKLGFPKNAPKKKAVKPNSSFSLTNNESIKDNTEVSDPDEKEQPINIATEYRPEHYNNGTGEGDNRKETYLTEIESAEIQINGKTLKSEAATMDYKNFRTIGDCRSLNIPTSDCTIQRELFSSKTVISNFIESYALDRLQLGQALEDAIRSGIFKSYTRLTKYPIRIRHLENMARAYLQSTR